MQYEFISNHQELEKFCQQASQAKAIAVDTEFVRTRTLYPQIGLIQLYDGNRLVLVDPLAIDDCSSLCKLLTNTNVVKILHSCSEDLETFWHEFNIIPKPIFDTQFAASITGKGTALGYAKLVEAMLDIHVDKGESRTDWLARPLREQQCEYAAKDVLYLYQLYPQLRQEIDEQNKLAWVYQEIEQLAEKKTTALPLDSVYLGFKNNWKLSGKALLTLQRLAAWRTQTARQKDMSLNFVVREENLFAIATQQPKSRNELRNIQGLNAHEFRIHADVLLSIVKECQQASEADYPPNVQRLNDLDGYKNIASKVKKVCAQVAEENDVPPELLGSKKQINQLLKWLWFDNDETRSMGLVPDLLSNWRGQLLTERLAKIDGLNLPAKAS